METANIRNGIGLGLFKILNKSNEPKSTKQLAELTKADPILLGTAEPYHRVASLEARLTDSRSHTPWTCFSRCSRRSWKKLLCTDYSFKHIRRPQPGSWR